MFVFYKHDKSSIYEENAIHYPFNGALIYKRTPKIKSIVDYN